MAKKKLSPVQVQLIAESLLPSFLPKNKEEKELQFNFTAEGTNWQVEFTKSDQNWQFKNALEVKDEL